MKNIITTVIAAAAIIFSVSGKANVVNHFDRLDQAGLLDQLTHDERDFLQENLDAIMTSADSLDLSESGQYFMGSIVGQIENAAGKAFNFAKALGKGTLKNLKKMGISQEVLQKIPKDIIKQGLPVIVNFVKYQGLATVAEDAAGAANALPQDNLEFSFDDPQYFLGGIIDKIKHAAEKAFDFTKSLGQGALDTLHKVGISNDVLKKVPEEIIKQGLPVIINYVKTKGLATVAEDAAEDGAIAAANGLPQDELEFGFDNNSQYFLGGILDKIKDAAEKAFDFAKSLGKDALNTLHKVGISDEVLKKVPQEIIKQGLPVIIKYIKNEGLATIAEDAAMMAVGNSIK